MPQKKLVEEQPQHRASNKYRNLTDQLSFFFLLRGLSAIVGLICVLYYTNNIFSIEHEIQAISLSSNTRLSIYQFFHEAELQIGLISNVFAEIVEKQIINYNKYGELFYKSLSQSSEIEKIIFKEKYGTDGVYRCMQGNCTCLNFYLKRLWAKKIFQSSNNVLYLKYYDPVEQQDNIAYAPADLNVLTDSEIHQILEQATQDAELIKKNEKLFFFQQTHFNLSFNSSYDIRFAIQLNKQNGLWHVTKDIEAKSYYSYAVRDSKDWITSQNEENMPILSSIMSYRTEKVQYVSDYTNKTLITFNFETPVLKRNEQYLRLVILLVCFIMVAFVFLQIITIKKYLTKSFVNVERLIFLYRFNINQLFTGKKSKASMILGPTVTAQFFQELSQIPSSQYEPITHQKKVEIRSQPFRFVENLKDILYKYNSYASEIFREKNREIISNKFFIQSSINEISESEASRMKQQFNRCKQLGMAEHFFKFCYLSVLQTPDDFMRSVSEDKTPLPQETLQIVREINRTINSTDIRRAFKLADRTLEETSQQLEMRIQMNLLQKYLVLLKQLDIQGTYAKGLSLEKEIENLNEHVENVKHVLNKHNKNIRMLGR